MEQTGSWYFFRVSTASGIWTSLQSLEDAGKVVIEVVPIYEGGDTVNETPFLAAVLIRALGG
jgi:hypothetical protein